MSQSWMRNASFFMKGMKEFTRSGYDKASRTFQEGDVDTDMTGRSCLVTGANSGIGYCVALSLARAGATVHMVCRSEQRGVEARERIVEAASSQKVHLHVCDLSRTRDVLRFCSEFVGAGAPLDVLVHNAGCMVHTRTTNEDELEVNFATNTLAPYVITNQLLPLLERSQDPRVVMVSSGGMYTVKLIPDDLNATRLHKFDGTFVYAQNKRQQIVMNRAFARSHPSVHFSAMHPGWADTAAVQTAMPAFYKLLHSKLRTPVQGADTAHWLCVTRRIREFPSGSFFLDRQLAPEHLNSGTHSTGAEEEVLIRGLREILHRFLPPSPAPTPSGATPPSPAPTSSGATPPSPAPTPSGATPPSPAPTPSGDTPTSPAPTPSGATPPSPAPTPCGATPPSPAPTPSGDTPTSPAPTPSGATPPSPAPTPCGATPPSPAPTPSGDTPPSPAPTPCGATPHAPEQQTPSGPLN